MTIQQSIKQETWSLLKKIGFRFSFIYFALIITFQNNGAYPFWGLLMQKPNEWLYKLIPWVGENILNISYEIRTGPNGSGDTTYDYLVVFVIFVLAIIGMLVWSLLDRKRINYTKLYYWLSVALRFYVGLMLINYGMVKVIQLQFQPPTFYRLLETYGESSPMGLAWTFLGFSKGYNLFMGIAEVLAGLLLFRRTLTFGAIITLMTTMNVMAVNYFFDVPVKILSTHLVLMTLFLLSRDLPKLIKFFFTKKSIQLEIIKQPFKNRQLKIVLMTLKGLFLGYIFIFGAIQTLGMQKQFGAKAPKPAMYGLYEIKDFKIKNDTVALPSFFIGDNAWKYLAIEREGRLQLTKQDRSRDFYSIETDTTNQVIKFTGGNSPAGPFDFNYKKLEDSYIDFNFIYQSDTIIGKAYRPSVMVLPGLAR